MVSHNTGSGYGVYGDSVSGTGIYGSSVGGVGYAGVFGNGDATNATGVAGECTGTSCSGVYGSCSGTNCYAAYFANDIYVNGTVYPPSDRRFKKNVAPVLDAIDQLLKLQGVNFEWIEPEKHNDSAGTQIGFIAQDVEKVFPSWVKTDAEGFKALSISQIEGLEVESIRMLKLQNDLLAQRVKELESGHRPLVSGLDLNGVGFGVGGLAIGFGLVVVARRKRPDERATA
jgi:hypothetical protein